MTVDVEVVDPRHDPEPSGWSDFRRSQHLHPPWDYGLLAVEAWLSRNPPLLAVAREAGAVVAAMAVMVCAPAQRRYGGPSASRFLPRLAQVYQPWLGAQGFVWTSEADGPTVLRALERGVRARLGPGLAGMLYRNVPADLAPALAGRGRVVRPVAPAAAVLANTWGSDEEWLASLSRNRRKNVRRVDRLVAEDTSLRVRFTAGRSDVDAVELADLLRAHRASFGRQPFDPRTPVAAPYLAALVTRSDVRTMTYTEPDGRVVAFSTYLDHPVRPILQFWATRRRDDGGRAHLYFDCHARAVRHVIATARRELFAGRGMFEQKRSLGFDAMPMCVVGVPRPVLGR